MKRLDARQLTLLLRITTMAKLNAVSHTMREPTTKRMGMTELDVDGDDGR